MKSGNKIGARKFPTDAIREVLADRRAWVYLGIVTKFAGESSHYEIDGEDIVVDVQLAPDGYPALCRLGVSAGGPGAGVWFIPPEGAEVLVCVPEGELEADPVIVAILSTGQVPDGVAPGVTVIAVPAGGQVLVHDGSASEAVPLATLADVQAVQDALDGHRHGPGTFAAGGDAVFGLSGSVSVPAPVGTSVIKGK